MQKFQGIDTPGVGHYDPLKETIEDTHKKKVMKRLNMYNAGMSKFNKSHNAINNLLQSEPASAQHNRSIQNSVAESRAESRSGVQIVTSQISKYRHISPN